MKFINPKVELIEQEPGIEGIKKMIEVAGRTCYKSSDRITKDSYEKFVYMMVESGHGAMLEHGTVYLVTDDISISRRYNFNKYSVLNTEFNGKEHKYYITTNYRVLVENGWLYDLDYAVYEPTMYHERRVTFRLTMDRIGTQSVVRHRADSFGQESTRFCNYSKDKFGNEISISIPHFTSEYEINEKTSNDDYSSIIEEIHDDYMKWRNGNKERKLFDKLYYWLSANEFCEYCYFSLLDSGLNPEDARSILPFDLSSEIVVTGFVSDWKHFIDLRYFGTTGKPHPDIKPIAEKIYLKLKEKGLL